MDFLIIFKIEMLTIFKTLILNKKKNKIQFKLIQSIKVISSHAKQ